MMPVILFVACKNETKTNESGEVRQTEPTFEIAPPIEEYNPSAEVFSIDNSKDTILISENGSFINVPANCFKDEAGRAVQDVAVEFTEYVNPADILFSGIPMEYVTEAGNETFQSAGMCEVNATSNGSNVSISDGKSIDIGLKNQAQDADYNLYFFDKQKGEWIEKEKEMSVDFTPIPTKPLATSVIDSSRVVHVDINHHRLSKNFQMWDQSNFYLLPGQQPRYHETSVFWYDLNVLETTNPEIFVLKFKGNKGGEQVVEALTVQPLVTPENYEVAMKLFESKMRSHAKLILKNKKGKKEQLLSADETIVQINKEHEELKEQLRIEDSIRVIDEKEASEVQAAVFRTFQVNQLGLYNCDRFYVREILATRKCNFKYENEKLKFNQTYLCSPSDNAVLTSVSGNDGDYTIDLSSGTFYFVGLKGKDIYCKKVNAQTANGGHEIEQITKEEFERIMI